MLMGDLTQGRLDFTAGQQQGGVDDSMATVELGQVAGEGGPGVLEVGESGSGSGDVAGVELALVRGGGTDDGGGDDESLLDAGNPFQVGGGRRPGQGSVGLQVPSGQGCSHARLLRLIPVLSGEGCGPAAVQICPSQAFG